MPSECEIGFLTAGEEITDKQGEKLDVRDCTTGLDSETTVCVHV